MLLHFAAGGILISFFIRYAQRHRFFFIRPLPRITADSRILYARGYSLG